MQSTHQKMLGYTLSRINRIWNQKFIHILNKKGYYNLKPSFFTIFIPLFENDGQSAAEITRSSNITKQTVSIYARELQTKGYVKYTKDTHDKRIQRLFLTAKGAMLQKVFDDASREISKKVCKQLNDKEILLLISLLQKCFKK